MTWEEAERMMALIREQQARINATMALLDDKLNSPTEKTDRTCERTIALLATAKHMREMRKVDEHLNVLLKIVERYTSEGRNGKA